MDAASTGPGRNDRGEVHSGELKGDGAVRNRFPIAGQGVFGTIKKGRVFRIVLITRPFPVPRKNPRSARSPRINEHILTVGILGSRIPHEALSHTSRRNSDAMVRIQPVGRQPRTLVELLIRAGHTLKWISKVW